QDAQAPQIESLPELMAHAYAIEAEAEARYRELADQMAVHNNPEVAALFHKLAEYEGLHAQHLLARAPDLELPDLAPWDFKWLSLEAPELVGLLDVHYLMTPQQALTLALAAEEAAFRFFDRVARSAGDPDVRAMAQTFANDEQEHIRMVRDLLNKKGPARPDWDEDLDPATSQG
ncbi:MAG: ferritin family protein, partial [Pseudomonadota bacterium]